MKIEFKPTFKGKRIEGQIGDKAYSFENSGTPFEVDEPLGNHLLRTGHFQTCAEEKAATPTAELPKPAVKGK